jgi:hypothetical protein
VQTETLRQEYLKQYNKKEEFKTELIDVKKKNIKIDRKILDVEITIEGMMEMLEGDDGTHKKNIKITNPKIRKKIMEEQKKRQREMLQKKMAAGVDFLGDTNVKVNKDDTNRGWFQKSVIKFGELIESMKPFKSDLVQIRANYDKSIILFFEILQQMFIIHFVTALLFSYLIIEHYL